MTDHQQRIQAAFRLNLEQQKKRAKDLLKAARAGSSSALSRIAALDHGGSEEPAGPELKLADAQSVIARELGFSSWPELKIHIASMDRERKLVGAGAQPLDAGPKTLHLRCGSDIRPTLLEAGFKGDFLEVSYPYCHGPVTASPDHLEQEARFIAEFAGKHMKVSFAGALARRYEEERALAASAGNYQRIVLWMEHDCFDQLVLLRCLAHYASVKKAPVLELVGVNHFPGAIRFIGLGQLPAEALRLLWERRRAVTQEQLVLAAEAWRVLTLQDPRALAAVMRTGSAALPDLAPALHRLLRELPSVEDGLSFTERLVLQILSEETSSIRRLFATLTYERDPLPFATDLLLLHVIERMQSLSDPVLTRLPGGEAWQDALTITDMGRKVLRGEVDFLSLRPGARWVGSIEIRCGAKAWRWNEQRRDAVVM